MKKLLKLGSLMALMLVFAVGCAQASGGGASSPGTAKDGNEQKIEAAAIRLMAATEEVGYTNISTEDLKKKIDAGDDMIIIDTMPKKSYDSNRIPGALNAELPVKIEDVTDEQRAAFVEALGQDKEKTIILYCGFVSCERSHVGAIIAKEEGFTNILRQPGGIIAWIDAGYEVEK